MDKQNEITSRPGKVFLHLIFAITMIATTFLGLFIFSRSNFQSPFFQRTDFFWMRLIWFEAIMGVLWYAFTGNYLKRLLSERKQTGAIYVVTGTAYFKFALYSFIVWAVGCFLPISIHWQGGIWLLQFCLIIFYAWLLYFIPHMQLLQSSGMEDLPDGVISPEDLANELLALESSTIIPTAALKKIKKVREKIKYSIPRVGKVGSSENYRLLTREVTDFYKLSPENIGSQIVSFEDSVMKKILMIQNECKN